MIRPKRRDAITNARLTGALKGAALALLVLPLLAAAPAPASAPAPAAAVKLWRLDCGAIWIPDLNDFSDTRAYGGRSLRLTASCYLIRHGDAYMLWDTGLNRSELGKTLTEGAEESAALKVSIVDQLSQIGVKPEQVEIVGISHYHYDHTGQATDFPAARLLIGKGDLERVRASPGLTERLAPWITGKSAVEGVSGDKDVFGDGSVVMLDLPGHTPGHHGLMVRLARTGWVVLSGDAAHFRENLQTDGVPGFNTDRAQTLASLDRLRRLARNLKATLIIQHDERDVAKLPAFPQAAD